MTKEQAVERIKNLTNIQFEPASESFYAARHEVFNLATEFNLWETHTDEPGADYICGFLVWYDGIAGCYWNDGAEMWRIGI